LRVLIVDDEISSAKAVGHFLENVFNYEITICQSGFEALERFSESSFPVVILDIRMPEMTGIELLRRIRELPEGKKTVAVLMTGYADLETAIEALRSGAYDYLRKPIDAVMLSVLFSRITTDLERERSFDLLDRFGADTGGRQIINIPDYDVMGVFSGKLREAVNLALMFHRDPSIPVLIQGETGTGKEGIARLVHHGRERNNSPFITINCSSISPGLFESELFGYEAGAFTGAAKNGAIGKLELAQEGTIFLDEIGDMPLEMQPKLLRVLEEREIYRVGGAKKVSLKIRIIASTNHDLEVAIEEGRFRRDLYHRLNVGPINLVALQNRPEAIIPLSQLFLDRFSREKNRSFKFIDENAQDILCNHTWKGNIRELRNVIERIVILYDDESISVRHLSDLIKQKTRTDREILKPAEISEIGLPPDGFNLRKHEEKIILRALEKLKGNKSKAARYLGMSRTTLNSRLEKMGMRKTSWE